MRAGHAAWPLRRGEGAAPEAMPPQSDQLVTVRQGYCALVAVAAAVQVLFFYRAEFNLISTLMAAVSSLLGIAYSLNSVRFRAHPVSALVLLLYTTTATSGALLVKTLEQAPLVDRLQLPVTTFGVLLTVQLLLLLADLIYLRMNALQAVRRWLAHRIIGPVGVMKWPTDGELWLMGLAGCVSVLLTGTDFESEASFGIASAGMKLMRAFGFLKFAPFLIPFREALSGKPSPVRLPMLALTLYFVALVGISFATNSRSTFADAIPTVLICMLIARSQGRLDLSKVSPVTLIMVALGAAVAGVLLSRVALAMVVVRDYRHTADVGSLVAMTMEALFNSEWLEGAKSRMDSAVSIANYSETYVDSRFFARFLLTKFHDNILYYFSLMGPDQITSYKGFMLDRLAGTLPDPLLRAFGIMVNKQDLVVSNGDYTVYLVDGWGLGGFKSGSLIAEVVSVFGWAFPLVVLVCALLLFVFHDAFVMVTRYRRLAFSPLILLLIWNLCGTTAAFGLGAESVTAIPAGIARGLPQNVLVYVLAVAVLRAAGRLRGRG